MANHHDYNVARERTTHQQADKVDPADWREDELSANEGLHCPLVQPCRAQYDNICALDAHACR